MDIFWTLFTNLLPLYVIILLGWVAGRFFGAEHKTLGALGIYIIMPVIAFGFVAKLDFQPAYIALPFIVFTLTSLITIVTYKFALRTYPDKRANLLSMCAGAGNTGYFGLPLVILLFDETWVALYIFTMTGYSIYEATVMYYIANRGNFSPRQSLEKLLKFPTIYTIIAALIANAMQIELSAQFDTYWTHFKGAYIIIGMMLIGAALSKVEKLVIGPRFLAMTFMGKFLLWPLVVLGFVVFDQNVTQAFGPEIYAIFWVTAIVPPAANTAAFAAQLDLNPEKAATTILIGTIFALFYIPFMIWLIGIGPH